MIIELEEEAGRWIRSKGRQLTVKMQEVKTCCAPGVQEMLAIPGKPKALEQYNEFQVNDVELFVQKNLCGKDKLSLSLSGALFMKSLSAKLQ